MSGPLRDEHTRQYDLIGQIVPKMALSQISKHNKNGVLETLNDPAFERILMFFDLQKQHYS